jgi:hypothetical protein
MFYVIYITIIATFQLFCIIPTILFPVRCSLFRLLLFMHVLLKMVILYALIAGVFLLHTIESKIVRDPTSVFFDPKKGYCTNLAVPNCDASRPLSSSQLTTTRGNLGCQRLQTQRESCASESFIRAPWCAIRA